MVFKVQGGSRRLKHVIQALLACTHYGELGSLVLDVALADMSAAMLQLAFEPVQFTAPTASDTALPDLSPSATPAMVISLHYEPGSLVTTLAADERLAARKDFDALTHRLKCGAVLHACFCMTGGAANTLHPWLSDAISVTIVDTVLRPGGVSSLVGLLLEPSLSQPSSQPQCIERASALLSTLPPACTLTMDQYCGRIATQCKLLIIGHAQLSSSCRSG